MNWDWLKSRAFWTALGPTVAAICALAGVTDETTTAILTLVTAFSGFWIVTGARAYRSGVLSYAEMQRVLKAQERVIEHLRPGGPVR